MIQANEVIELSELRIGNILTYDGRFVHVTSLSMDIDDEYEDTIGFCYLGESSNEKGGWNRSIANKLKRVALSPELLEKCGFEKIYASYVKNGIVVLGYGSSGIRGDGWHVGLQEFNAAHIVAIQHLHQLQNLYFALTGEELQVNL